MTSARKIRIAILDLYEGQPNQGMRCIRELLAAFAQTHNLHFHLDEFEVRLEKQVPDLSYDIYISSGGPGSPLESIDSAWETAYFSWLQRIDDFNRNTDPTAKKQVL